MVRQRKEGVEKRSNVKVGLVHNFQFQLLETTTFSRCRTAAREEYINRPSACNVD